MPAETGTPENEIEVTPEMIEAGTAVLWELDLDHNPYERIVRDVFRAMVRSGKVSASSRQ